MFKSFLLASLLFIGVLIGMQKANEGITKMKGFEDQSFQAPISFQKDSNYMETSLLGKEVSSHDLEKKKEKLEEMKAFNFFSTIGKYLAATISSIVATITEWFASLI